MEIDDRFTHQGVLMATVLVFVLVVSALAFFSCFFLALCQDQRRSRRKQQSTEVIRLSGMRRDADAAIKPKRSA